MTPVLESLFNKVAGLKACKFIKRDSIAAIAKYLRTTIFWNICERLSKLSILSNPVECFENIIIDYNLPLIYLSQTSDFIFSSGPKSSCTAISILRHEQMNTIKPHSLTYSKAYLQPCQTFKMELFAKIVKDYQTLTICANISILDV